MTSCAASVKSLGRTLHWFPEFLKLGPHQIRAQVRLMGLAVLVRVVAGLEAIVFYVATQGVERYALGKVPSQP